MKTRSQSKAEAAIASAPTTAPSTVAHDDHEASAATASEDNHVKDSSLPVEDFLREFLPMRDEPPLPSLDFESPLPCDADPNATALYYSKEETASAIRNVINGSGIYPHFFFNYLPGPVLAAIPPELIQGVDIPTGNITVDPEQIMSNVKVTIELEEQSGDIDEEARRGKSARYPGIAYESGQTLKLVLDTFTAQRRTHVYAVKIYGPRARLVRYDPVGLVVSELFDWRTNHGHILADFLLRLRQADSNSCLGGLDDSIGDPLAHFSAEDLVAADASINEFVRDVYVIPDGARPHAIACWDDGVVGPAGLGRRRVFIAAPAKERYLKISNPFIKHYIGYDVETRRSYHIKDTWAIEDREDEESDQHYVFEGQTYQTLQAAGVQHIAEFECAGVVRWQDGTAQRTRSPEFCSQLSPKFTRYQRVHYRIVFRDIGRPLVSFKNTYELVRAIGQALVAHGQAYRSTRILHNDVSPWNIRINRKGKALLGNWELATIVPMANEFGALSAEDWHSVRGAGRWRILSGHSFIPGPMAHDSRERIPCATDDLESFFWVLLFCLFRYRYAPVQWTVPSEAPFFRPYCKDLFKDRVERSAAVDIRDTPKLAFLHPRYPHPSDLELQKMVNYRTGLQIPRPLGLLLCRLRRAFSQVHFGSNLNPTEDPGLAQIPDVTGLNAHSAMISCIIQALREAVWYGNDSADDRLAASLDSETLKPDGDFSARSKLQSSITPSSTSEDSVPSTSAAPPSPPDAAAAREEAESAIWDLQRRVRSPDASPLPAGRLARVVKQNASYYDMAVRTGKLTPAQRQKLKEYVYRYHPSYGLVAPAPDLAQPAADLPIDT
ncbi:unnamed protein product [Peniophora sp. CBMAI 1063]|nr:unnamed protein product [Peniophora sp. CBMAI 1063]